MWNVNYAIALSSIACPISVHLFIPDQRISSCPLSFVLEVRQHLILVDPMVHSALTAPAS